MFAQSGRVDPLDPNVLEQVRVAIEDLRNVVNGLLDAENIKGFRDLTNGANADYLHKHRTLNSVDNNEVARITEDGGFSTEGDILAGGDVNVADSKEVITDIVRARDAAGLRLEDDGDKLGVFVDDGGNVGIGTDSPSKKFQVEGTSQVSASFGNSTGSSFVITRVTEAASNSGAIGFAVGSTPPAVIGSTNLIAFLQASCTQATPSSLKGELVGYYNEGDSNVEGFRLHDNGIWTIGNQSKAAAYLNADQTITDSTQTTVVFDTEDYDTQNEFNTTNGTFTAKEIGWYHLSFNLLWESRSWTAGDTVLVYVNHNGTLLIADVREVEANFTGSIMCKGSRDVYLTIGQTLKLDVYQVTGGNADVDSGADHRTSVSIHKFA